MRIPPLRPERSASTSSATSATGHFLDALTGKVNQKPPCREFKKGGLPRRWDRRGARLRGEGMRARPIVTLLTDFGMQDPFVGIMKGIILGLCPEAGVVDLCHEVRPFDIHGASFLLQSAVGCFPEGAVHLAVVDPGVGSERRPILAEIDGRLFVAPDNGILGYPMASGQRCVIRQLSARSSGVIRSAPRFTVGISLLRWRAILPPESPRSGLDRSFTTRCVWRSLARRWTLRGLSEDTWCGSIALETASQISPDPTSRR